MFCGRDEVVNAPKCASDDDCAAVDNVTLFCSRSWNRDLEYLWKSSAPDFGHCVDPSGAVAGNASLQADLCSLPDSAAYGMGLPYRLPPNGTVLLKDIGMVEPSNSKAVGLAIFRRTILDGAGAMLIMPNTPATMIGVDLITPNDNQLAASAGHAGWSSVLNLGLRPLTDGNTTNTGLLLHTHGVRLTNVRVNGLGTCIDADSVTNVYNVNTSQWENVLLEGCKTYAAYLHGYDTNAGFFRGVEVLGGVGIRDSSFSHSTWIGVQTEDTAFATNDPTAPAGTMHSISVEGVPYSTVIGTYLENSDPAPRSSGAVLWVGGAAAKRAPEDAERLGNGRSRLVFQSSDTGYQVVIPGTTAEQYAIHVQNRAEEQFGYRLRVLNGQWGFWHEDNVSVGFTWKSSDVASERGRFSLGSKATAEAGYACCDGVDNDANGALDCADPSCAGVGVCGCQ